jgi:hypothetical protein
VYRLGIRTLMKLEEKEAERRKKRNGTIKGNEIKQSKRLIFVVE